MLPMSTPSPADVVARFDARLRALGTAERGGGWVLREVSEQRPALVRDFLLEHAGACSGATWREAIKYLPAAMSRAVAARRGAAADGASPAGSRTRTRRSRSR
jgi:hypothetical protein